jgi:hypothetical protein
MAMSDARLGPAFRERSLRWSRAMDTLQSSPMAYGYLVAATPLSYLLGLAHPYLMPALNALVIYPLFLAGIRSGRLRTTMRQVMVWAVTMTVTVIALTLLWPEQMQQGVLGGEGYKGRMLDAIRSSAGAEGTWQGFVAKYVREGGIFLLLAVASAGLLALAMGAYLMNYMNYYVGYLFATAKNPVVLFFIGWPPWSIARVLGFNLAALGLSFLVLQRVLAGRWRWTEARRFVQVGMGFIVLNVLLRLALEPYWKVWLQPQL